MGGGLLIIGLDAVEAPLLRELMAAGELPALSAIDSTAPSQPVEASCMSTLPGAIWQDIVTGQRAGRHGDYYPQRVHTGEVAPRRIDPTAHAGTYFFDHLAAAGRDVIVIDLPLVAPYAPAAPLTLVAEWSLHDAIYARGTYPTALLAELEGRFGVRPRDRCDNNHPDSDAGRTAFAEHLIEELAAKTDMALHLMQTRPWDAFAFGISSGHCAGHQLWGLHESASGLDQSPLVAVYRAIDRSIARLVEAAGDGTNLVVFTSHGMGPYIGGPKLLPPLLDAWGYGSSRPRVTRLRRWLPLGPIERAVKAGPEWLRAGAMAASNRAKLFEPRLDTTTKMIVVENNRVGAIRVNLRGREPHGTVAPQDLDALLDELTVHLMSVRQVGSGEPVVARCIRSAEAYGPDHHPDLPDLMVVFRRDLGELVDVECPETGQLHVPNRTPYYRRSGDHTDASVVWVRHPDVTALQLMRSEDIAPTLLTLAGVAVPDTMDGRCAVDLLGVHGTT
jgi:predicted AlkP superfamily phosphohydrolase/phosphomutase